jgi:outer membrane protein assembly factor BamB
MVAPQIRSQLLYKSIAPVVLVFMALTSASATDQWPQFRGLQAGVAADDPALPDRWTPTENIVWKIDVPGIGWSSPVVWDDHIFVTSVISEGEVEPPKPGLFYAGERPTSTDVHRWMVYDIEFATGRIRWQREVRRAAPFGPKHLKNSYASETPVTDGERVYAYFGSAGLFVFDLNGKPIWSRDSESLSTRAGWGTAASPVLHQGRLYVLNDNNTQSFIAAFDKRTGQLIWRVNRDEGTNWTSPVVWQHDLGTEIVTSGTGKVRSYDLEGKLRWELKGMSSISVPTPFAANGLLYAASGFPGDARRPVYAIRPGASGDISLKDGETSNGQIAWSNPLLGTYVTTALVYGEYFYTLLDRGLFWCHDARTGRQIYGRQRLTAGGFTASPWAYNGKIFAMSEEGETYVIQAGPEFKVLAVNSLDEMTLATPAVAQGSLIVRTASRLYRISKGAPK